MLKLLALKILHTADWHIGKVLHKYDLEEDHHLFFDWLINTIINESIDILIVAGDVFDHSNPTNLARKTYYDILANLASTGVRIIITGGNHDSVSHLESSQDLLKLVQINVIGGANENLENEIIPIYHKNGELALLILAVPYLRDKDIRNFVSGESEQDRIKAIRSGILKHYDDVKSLAVSKYGKHLPIIAMGHLFVQGASISESEREIQVGNLAGILTEDFEDSFDYMALGHIHRPQSFANGKIQYCGSPISLSFSERKDEKRCVKIELKNDDLTISSVPIPKFRNLIKIKGDIEDTSRSLENISNTLPLKSLIEIEVQEDLYDPTKMLALNQIVQNYDRQDAVIVKHRIHFKNSPINISSLYTSGESIRDLNPREVFLKKIEQETNDEEQRMLLLEAFDEVLEEIQRSTI